MHGVKFKVVGVTFNNDDGTSRQQNIREMKSDVVMLEREPNNQYDTNAIKVLTEDGKQIGYIPGQYAQILGPMMDKGHIFEAKVKEKDCFEGTWYCHIIVNEV